MSEAGWKAFTKGGVDFCLIGVKVGLNAGESRMSRIAHQRRDIRATSGHICHGCVARKVPKPGFLKASSGALESAPKRVLVGRGNQGLSGGRRGHQSESSRGEIDKATTAGLVRGNRDIESRAWPGKVQVLVTGRGDFSNPHSSLAGEKEGVAVRGVCLGQLYRDFVDFKSVKSASQAFFIGWACVADFEENITGKELVINEAGAKFAELGELAVYRAGAIAPVSQGVTPGGDGAAAYFREFEGYQGGVCGAVGKAKVRLDCARVGASGKEGS